MNTNYSVRYIDKLDLIAVELNGVVYLADKIDDYERYYIMEGDEIRKVPSDEVPLVVKMIAGIFNETVNENIHEKTIMRRRLENIQWRSIGLPTEMKENHYQKFLMSTESDLVPKKLFETLKNYPIDPVHKIVGDYWTAYAYVHGYGYAIFDPGKELKLLFAAAKRFDGKTDVIPIEWWVQMRKSKSYTGNSSFTVYGKLHSSNSDSSTWMMSLYSKADGRNTVRAAHKAFLEVMREYAGIDFNAEIKKFKKGDIHYNDIIEFFEKNNIVERVYEGFERKADLEVFDEILLPESFQTPLNYVLLTEYNTLAFPTIMLQNPPVAGMKKLYISIEKKFKKFFS